MNPAVNQILDIFQDFRMPSTTIDEYDKGGKEKLADRLATFVDAGQTIQFSMLGYPFKSLNHRDKTLGPLPDLGENVSLINFGHFAERVGAVYGPGACFSIVSDGWAFSDLLDAPWHEVAKYSEILRDMAADLPIDFYDMYSFYPRNMKMPEMREKLMTDFAPTEEELQRRILQDPNVNALYRGMMFFMTEELAIREYPNRSQLQKAAKILTREMMRRNEAYSALVQKEFAGHIRLSMHQSTNNGAKYSFQLIPSQKARHSPWHSALLVHKDNSYETVHRKDAIAAGHELVYENGQPYYFTEL